MNSTYTLADLEPSIIVEPPQAAKAAVIWLHGLGADGHDFAGLLPQLGLPNNHAIRFIFPNAPVQAVTVNGGMQMRSWYDIYSMSIAEKMDLHSIEQSSLVLEELVQEQVDNGISADKIVIAGFSQGGLIALNMALTSDYTLAGVLALSTYYPQACIDSLERPAKCGSPIFMAHGEYDPVVPFAVAQSSVDRLKLLGCEVEWHSYPMEHQVCMPEVEAISEWLKKQLVT